VKHIQTLNPDNHQSIDFGPPKSLAESDSKVWTRCQRPLKRLCFFSQHGTELEHFIKLH